MRALKLLTIAMGVLIVLATAALAVVIAKRLSGAGSKAAPFAATLPAGEAERIAAIAGTQDRLAVWLSSGDPRADRVVFVDPRTGEVAGTIRLH